MSQFQTSDILLEKCGTRFQEKIANPFEFLHHKYYRIFLNSTLFSIEKRFQWHDFLHTLKFGRVSTTKIFCFRSRFLRMKILESEFWLRINSNGPLSRFKAHRDLNLSRFMLNQIKKKKRGRRKREESHRSITPREKESTRKILNLFFFFFLFSKQFVSTTGNFLFKWSRGSCIECKWSRHNAIGVSFSLFLPPSSRFSLSFGADVRARAKLSAKLCGAKF